MEVLHLLIEDPRTQVCSQDAKLMSEIHRAWSCILVKGVVRACKSRVSRSEDNVPQLQQTHFQERYAFTRLDIVPRINSSLFFLLASVGILLAKIQGRHSNGAIRRFNTAKNCGE